MRHHVLHRLVWEALEEFADLSDSNLWSASVRAWSVCATASAVVIEALVGALITGALVRLEVDEVVAPVPGESMDGAPTFLSLMVDGRVFCFATVVEVSDLPAVSLCALSRTLP